MKRLLAFSCLALSVFGGLFGCGETKNEPKNEPKKGEVHGKIYLGDKPLAMGSVTFYDNFDTSYRSKISDDGSYTIKGIPVGTAGVIVISRDPSMKPKTGRKIYKDIKKDERPKDLLKGGGREDRIEMGEKDPRWFPIPSEYGSPGVPLISFAIQEGDNLCDIKLTDPPPKNPTLKK